MYIYGGGGANGGHHTSGHEDLRQCWHELKSAILRIYRESGLVLNHTFMTQNRIDVSPKHNQPLPHNDTLKDIVHKLCVHDRHKLYQCLEAQVRLFVVEMRLNLLKHLEHGSQALFEAMIDQYGRLCRASKQTAQFLQELESKHLRKFNLTWEFLNRRLFQSTVYSDTFIKHGLPKLTALTKDRSLIDMYARFLKFEDEMTVISVVWREAQQFIDKYEKFAILNKKRALIKEWEQFSVEWVLDDHVSGGGGGGGKGKATGESPMCIKKPSIECLNARFLEEQKLLKSGKNMQSVNIEIEINSALQEQTLLAAYGEWDAIDIKTIATNLPSVAAAANKHLKSATAATQVDLLLTSKALSSAAKSGGGHDSPSSVKVGDQCGGSGGRVCDCCYCEVFGHGMPAVAPTSRNYNEMRERLRLRLSKRKAEKCEKNGLTTQAMAAIAIGNDTGGGGAAAVASGLTSKCKESSNAGAVASGADPPARDDRDLEELINFINGTDSKDKRNKAKREKAKKQKNKDKTKTERVGGGVASVAASVDQKPSEAPKQSSNSSANNMATGPTATAVTAKSEPTKLADNIKLNLMVAQQLSAQQHRSPTGATTTAKHLNNAAGLNGLTTTTAATNGGHTAKNANTNGSAKTNGSNKKKIKISNDRNGKEDNHYGHTTATSVANHHNHHNNNIININNANNKLLNNEQQLPKQPLVVLPNGVIPHHKQNGSTVGVANGSAKHNQQLIQNNQSSQSPERADNTDIVRQISKQKQNKINRNLRKKNNTEEALSPDEVFMPKDIDLDNGELDEFEKELEAFKRFCFNSVPLKVKEKVNVNLKDIVIKKKE
ncbi:unnamed protein product [Medioppia subpectinata]|uniref:FAM193 C-terminal domain-containing protein n=1 Tax=Medioppia subpectinata TaxID=1979941 RepID=A0A7R9KUS3_9ACAR|nr:unnamed protein product [Medioppia subpectinata]CAG2109826.1 unnamed protein product [Medioppia subpectinata]